MLSMLVTRVNFDKYLSIERKGVNIYLNDYINRHLKWKMILFIKRTTNLINK